MTIKTEGLLTRLATQAAAPVSGTLCNALIRSGDALNQRLRLALDIAAVLGTISTACAIDSTLQSQAKISKSAAEKIALSKVPAGTIQSAELEKERGKLIWSFDISKPGTKDITEVQVDARNGGIVSVQIETPAAQIKERKSEP